MGSKGLGRLLPRDFLERQPKRWQKSQRKRGAVRALTKLASQRKKLEERAISDQRRDAARRAGDDTLPEKPHRERQLQRAEAKRREASAVTAIGARRAALGRRSSCRASPSSSRFPRGRSCRSCRRRLRLTTARPA